MVIVMRDMEEALQLILSPQEGDAEELRRDVLERAFNYTEYRFRWGLYTPEERAENDSRRTSAHNAFMDAVNIYVRYMNGARGTALEGMGPDRRENGDLACRIVYEEALANR